MLLCTGRAVLVRVEYMREHESKTIRMNFLSHQKW